MNSHITWSIETPVGCCPRCGTATILCCPDTEWGEVDPPRDGDGYQFVGDEVSGHVCPNCATLCSLSLNTADH